MTDNELELLKLLVTTISIVLAFFAYGRWRTEMMGKDKYSVVRKIGMKFLELGDCLHAVRAYIPAHKPDVLPEIEFLVELKTKKLAEASKLRSELKFLNLEAKLFKLDFENEIDLMRGFILELNTANNAFHIALKLPSFSPDLAAIPEIRKQLFARQEDEFSIQIKNAVNSVTDKVIRIMSGKKTK